MGFDVYGINPKQNTKKPPLVKKVDDSDPIYFEGLSKKELTEYFDLKSKWDSENVGSYFRNNVWWWRPLWNFVSSVCESILTEKDIESGSYNDGHGISKTKANRIASRLFKLIRNGDVKAYESAYRKHQDSLHKDNWDKSYPFSEDNVREFANFCLNSGGFRIC